MSSIGNTCMNLRLKRPGGTNAWKQALIFNSLLIIIAILASRIVTGAFATDGFGSSPTPEALAETRRAMDATFSDMVPRSASPRSFWSDLVDRELRNHNMAAARGFLLVAPNMLDRNDVRAVKAAASAEPTGTEDQRLVRAALLFLPNDVRVRYERAVRPANIDMPIPADPASSVLPPEDGPADTVDDDADAASSSVSSRPAGTNTSFLLVGDLEDLASNARKWIANDQTDSFELRLTALSMLEGETTPGIQIGKAASIIKAAKRAHRLTPQYTRILEQRIEAILPAVELRPRLEQALRETAPLSVLGPRVQTAFAETVDQEALPRLAVELEQVNRIADATSPAGAIALIEQVRDPGDMRRARLIAEAGGDRAIALVSQAGMKALSAAETGISWSRALVLQIMGLAAAAMAMLWTVISALNQWHASRQRPIALI